MHQKSFQITDLDNDLESFQTEPDPNVRYIQDELFNAPDFVLDGEFDQEGLVVQGGVGFYAEEFNVAGMLDEEAQEVGKQQKEQDCYCEEVNDDGEHVGLVFFRDGRL